MSRTGILSAISLSLVGLERGPEVSMSHEMNSLNEFTRTITTIIFSIALLTSSSCCATSGWHSEKPEEVRRQIQSVAVVPATSAPEGRFHTYAKSAEAGAQKGAAPDVVMGALEGSAYGGKLGIAVYLGLMITAVTLPPIDIIPAFAAGGSVIGAAARGNNGAKWGAAKAVPAEETQKIEALISKIILTSNIQDKLAAHAVSAGTNLTNYSFSLEKGQEQAIKSDMVIEVKISSLGFLGGEGYNPSLAFFMDADVRSIQPPTGREFYRKTLRYLSAPKSFDLWTRDSEALLKQELETAVTSLAEEYTEDIFLVHDFYRGERLCFGLAGPEMPTLAWEAFPSSKDRAADPERALEHITDVTYDLRFGRSSFRNLPEADVIYAERTFTRSTVHDMSATEQLREVSVTENITSPIGQVVDVVTSKKTIRVAEPTIIIPLAPKMHYFFSVRARYKLNNQTRLTQWSPYYRFTTPAIQDVHTVKNQVDP